LRRFNGMHALIRRPRRQIGHYPQRYRVAFEQQLFHLTCNRQLQLPHKNPQNPCLFMYVCTFCAHGRVHAVDTDNAIAHLEDTSLGGWSIGGNSGNKHGTRRARRRKCETPVTCPVFERKLALHPYRRNWRPRPI
jgi:hypothetical protein